jgi:hypothetical protein
MRNHYNTSPGDVQDNDAFPMKVIAVAYPGGMWCAFRAPATWDNQRVADEGDELQKEVAEGLFWCLANSGRIYGQY